MICNINYPADILRVCKIKGDAFSKSLSIILIIWYNNVNRASVFSAGTYQELHLKGSNQHVTNSNSMTACSASDQLSEFLYPMS